MSWSKHVTLWCDGLGCSQWVDHGNSGVPETRHLARAEGWSTLQTPDAAELADLCYFHTKQGRAIRGFVVHDLFAFTDENGQVVRTEQIA